MGIHPKIGITGLPKSGKSAVLEKVVDMITNERKDERRSRNDRSQGMPIIGGMRTEPILEDGVRIGFECVDIITGDRAVMAHRDFGFGNRPHWIRQSCSTSHRTHDRDL